jgi:hypothetical protein
MSIPTKKDLTNVTRDFAKELRDVAKVYAKSEESQASLEDVKAIATMAEKAAESIDATDRQYVHPITADTLLGFATKVEAIAASSTDDLYRASLSVASGGLRTFVLRHNPTNTNEGWQFAD